MASPERTDVEKSDVAKQEETTLEFWQTNQIFEKSLEKDAPHGEFTFYDGPPFATGLPHAGSLLASVSKDLIPRYKTMRGYRVRRRWGWDTHGLPIESIVERKFGLKNKKEIVSMGIETFNEAARETVLHYVGDWKRYVERLGRWVDFDNSYKTMDPTFMESVWWALKQIHTKGHLYEGRKVLMFCPHCETPLSKAEITMDAGTYKDITEEAVTISFKLTEPEKFGLPENTYVLAWTTTPWTLPGNVGLAVGPEITYGVYKYEGENDAENKFVILATERAEVYGFGEAEKALKAEKILTGAELVGAKYEPLFEIEKASMHEGKKWEVIPADFVTTTDGTGIVHTAVIYGEDDYALGVKENLPMVQLLNPNGTYNDDAPEFLHGKYIKKAETEIKENLNSRGLLFAKAPNTHSYPHCYRCGTALIYNAVSSWFINIQAVKEKLLAENERITWVPEYLKHGRFQHIIETAPDWTISRNRFWATPLPIWKDAKGNVTLIGSLEELKEHTKKSGNEYFVMRHGEAENNAQDLVDVTNEGTWPLTEKGRRQADAAGAQLQQQRITKIYASSFARTKETAEIVARKLGIDESAIVYDERLHEFSFALSKNEKYIDAKKRFGEFLYELEKMHNDQNILIVTHGVGLYAFEQIIAGSDCAPEVRPVDLVFDDFATPKKLSFVPLPHNRSYALDYHLPYIDEVQLQSKEGEALMRIPEVVDCWVESGSMPFAEYHFPFENKDEFEKRTPGDFVSEYIGQTRAWFYYMHTMSVELFGHRSFSTVITTGNILAADGQKVSKSKDNYTDPYILFDRFSADAFRYYLMSSVVMQAEDLAFRDDELKEIQNRVVNMLRNVLAFYNLFKAELAEEKREEEHKNAAVKENKKPSTHPLDVWILNELAAVIQNATEAFDAYEVPRATRPMRDFIDLLSTWYVRRSRDRIKGDDEADKQHALHTLRTVLCEFSKCIAPVMPFLAEEVFQATKTEADPFSVHLAEWPTHAPVHAQISEDMARVRAFASEALMLRQKAGIKVRQPLNLLKIPEELSEELRKIIAEEVNVKEVNDGAAVIELDTVLTPELIREGDVREFVRALSDARKTLNLLPQDGVTVHISKLAEDVLRNGKIPGVSSVIFADGEYPYTAQLSIGTISFSIQK